MIDEVLGSASIAAEAWGIVSEPPLLQPDDESLPPTTVRASGPSSIGPEQKIARPGWPSWRASQALYAALGTAANQWTALNVHVERYIRQSLVLDACDLVVSHAGSGTMLAALDRGLPLAEHSCRIRSAVERLALHESGSRAHGQSGRADAAVNSRRGANRSGGPDVSA